MIFMSEKSLEYAIYNWSCSYQCLPDLPPATTLDHCLLPSHQYVSLLPSLLRQRFIDPLEKTILLSKPNIGYSTTRTLIFNMNCTIFLSAPTIARCALNTVSNFSPEPQSDSPRTNSMPGFMINSAKLTTSS